MTNKPDIPSINEQIRVINYHVKNGAPWVRCKLNNDGSPSPGSSSENFLVGYIMPEKKSQIEDQVKEITVIYRYAGMYARADDYQLSTISYSDLIEYMKPRN